MVEGPVLLTGAAGLLGTWLRRTAPDDVRLVGVTHRTRLPGEDEVVADLRDRAAVAAAVGPVRPALVIHTAYAHDAPSIVDATTHVAEAARTNGAALLHVSTDAVFSGDGSPRAEEEEPDPIADYGRWKAEAERIVNDRIDRAIVVRLPLIVSLDPEDHVVARIRAGADPRTQDPTSWFTDELRQPAAAAELAAAIWRIADLDPAERAGPWHLPGPETLSRYEIAQRIVAALGLPDHAIAPARTPPAARRPRHLDLTDDRARAGIAWSPTPVLT